MAAVAASAAVDLQYSREPEKYAAPPVAAVEYKPVASYKPATYAAPSYETYVSWFHSVLQMILNINYL